MNSKPLEVKIGQYWEGCRYHPHGGPDWSRSIIFRINHIDSGIAFGTCVRTTLNYKVGAHYDSYCKTLLSDETWQSLRKKQAICDQC